MLSTYLRLTAPADNPSKYTTEFLEDGCVEVMRLMEQVQDVKFLKAIIGHEEDATLFLVNSQPFEDSFDAFADTTTFSEISSVVGDYGDFGISGVDGTH